MAKNTSVELGDEIAGFIKGQVSAGRYGSASEVIRAGLRLLQDEEIRISALRSSLIEGEKSGEAVLFDIDQFVSSQKTSSHG